MFYLLKGDFMCHDAFRNYRLQPGHISQLGINLGMLFIITPARTAIIGDVLVARTKLHLLRRHGKTSSFCKNSEVLSGRLEKSTTSPAPQSSAQYDRTLLL